MGDSTTGESQTWSLEPESELRFEVDFDACVCSLCNATTLS